MDENNYFDSKKTAITKKTKKKQRILVTNEIRLTKPIQWPRNAPNTKKKGQV